VSLLLAIRSIERHCERRPLRGGLSHEFWEAWGNLSMRWGTIWWTVPRSSPWMSLQPGIPWRVAHQQSLPPLHRPRSECNKVILPVEELGNSYLEATLTRLSDLPVPEIAGEISRSAKSFGKNNRRSTLASPSTMQNRNSRSEICFWHGQRAAVLI